jgi:hypothetical protein
MYLASLNPAIFLLRGQPYSPCVPFNITMLPPLLYLLFIVQAFVSSLHLNKNFQPFPTPSKKIITLQPVSFQMLPKCNSTSHPLQPNCNLSTNLSLLKLPLDLPTVISPPLLTQLQPSHQYFYLLSSSPIWNLPTNCSITPNPKVTFQPFPPSSQPNSYLPTNLSNLPTTL